MGFQITGKREVESLGEYLKLLRVWKNYTQAEFAVLLGLSVSKYARIERGEDTINLEIFSNILDKFNLKAYIIKKEIVIDLLNGTRMQ